MVCVNCIIDMTEFKKEIQFVSSIFCKDEGAFLEVAFTSQQCFVLFLR